MATENVSSAMKMKNECFDVGKHVVNTKMTLLKSKVDETQNKAMTNMLMNNELVKQHVDKDTAHTMKAKNKKPTFEFTTKKIS